MDRVEILKRAQQEKKDEREIQIKDHSMMWSYVVMVLMAAIFSCIRAEQEYPIMDLSATVCSSVCAAMTYRFIKTKTKRSLFIAIIMLLFAVFATVRFCMGY